MANSQIQAIMESVLATNESVEVEVSDDKVNVKVDEEDIKDTEIEDKDDLVKDEFEDLDTDDKKVVESMRGKLSKIRSARNESKKPRKVTKRKARVTESRRSLKVKRRVNESLSDRDDEDITLSICPICGSKDFDQATDTCPICGEDVSKYIAKDIDEVPTDDEFTTIEINGEDKILVDQDGNTAIVEPDIVNDVLEPNTHELVVESDPENPIEVDSGIATFNGESPVFESENPEDAEDEDNVQMAFLRIDEPIDSVADILMEDNENRVDRKDEEDGIVLTAKLSTDFVEDVNESEEPSDVEATNDNIEVDLELEELPNGTLLHISEVDNVEDLVDIVNELLPEDVQINTADHEEGEEALESRRKVESGIAKIKRNGVLESFKCKTVRKCESTTVLANKDRKVTPKDNITTIQSETDIKLQSVLEKRSSTKESRKVCELLEKLGVPKKTLESQEGIKLVDELVKVCGNIKEFKSDVKATDGQTVTMESVSARKLRVRK